MTTHGMQYILLLFVDPEGPEPSLITDCMNTIHSWCLAPITSEYMGMDPEAVIEKIANTDLRETCEYVDAQSMITVNLVLAPVNSSVTII